ncbi:MAG: heat-inducible transcriptional repressor HrcA [Tissierellia bacterium]|nr:heat-inducible transcriptional repressor HrcA [Tissierellia bacterium]
MLSERESQILKYIIQTFIETGEPVGSRTIEKNYRVGLSSATIRNVMSDLEDMGYLQKTHTSSGRRPSQRALQSYVDRIVQRERSLRNQPRDSLIESLYKEASGIEGLLLRAGKLLSAMTEYATLTFIPQDTKLEIRQVFLKPVSKSEFIFVLMVGKDQVLTTLLYDEEGVTNRDLERINNFLVHEFVGKSVQYFIDHLEQRFYSEFYEDKNLIQQVLGVLRKEREEENELQITGLARLLDHPDFEDLTKVKTVTTIMKDKSELLEKIREESHPGIQVIIGSEDTEDNLHHLTLITSSYNTGGERNASLGILAPIRINYVQTINTILELDRSLKIILKGLTEEGEYDK